MKNITFLLRLILTSFMLLGSRIILISEPKQIAGDTLIRVGIMVNGAVMPDSLSLMDLSGGSQVEAGKFMEAVGGLFYPISHFYRQDGIVVQYGRYISFARLGFAKGFVSLNMVDMVPPVSRQLIAGRGYEYFAPLGFLSQAIAGEIFFNSAAGRLEISAGPPPGFGSVFPPASQVASAFQDSGFIVRMGEANKQFPVQYCLTGYTSNANGNNVGVPYFGIQLPPPPGLDSMYSIPLNYNIRVDEAVILIGKTPPKCKYFSYRSYLMNRFYDFPPPATRKKINASLGEATNLYRMRPELPLDSMFERKFAVIMVGDSILAAQVKQIILGATTEIDEADIHFDILPSGGLFRFGTTPIADWTNFLHRVALFDDTVAQNNYLDHPPLEVIQVTRANPSPPVLFSLHPFMPRASGITEFNYYHNMELLEDGIYNAYHNNYDIVWLSSTPFNLESYTAIQQGVDALGDNHDCLYIFTNDFQLGENDIALAYGVDHTQTGQAVYDNVIMYGKKYYNGFGGITNDLMVKSARQYLSDTVAADKLYAYCFARHPVSGNPFVFIVPSDTTNTLSGINVEDTAFLCTRLYVNSITKIGPDPLEVVVDRFILLRPKSSGIFDSGLMVPSIRIYPNPVKDKAKIEVQVPEWSEVEISLITSSGQQIGNTIRFDHIRGKVWQEMNFGSGYPSGIYFVRVMIHEIGSNKEQVVSSRLVLLSPDLRY
jgi:hypothetical protein